MASSNNDEIISTAKPHTVKKFELVEAYVLAWAHKLLEYGRRTGNCRAIVFIDCMSNSGMYRDISGEITEGTPIRVANVIAKTMREQQYQGQHAYLYFNDFSKEKIEELEKHVPKNTHNFHIYTSVGDGNDLLKHIGNSLSTNQKYSYLLFYDPYKATIDWKAIMPFLSHWGEVIINHMLSDSIRAVRQAKTDEAIEKYEQTYCTSIENIIPFGSDKQAYQTRVEQIIDELKGTSQKKYYVAAFPFFNRKNAIEYNLIHCTRNIEGFKLYKSTTWRTFDDKSALKQTETSSGQLGLFFPDALSIEAKSATDGNCYYVQDIVAFVENTFKGQQGVPLQEIWSVLDEHPVFPSDLYKQEIKDRLKLHGHSVHRSTIDFK